MRYLILGATSYIGDYVYNRMKENHITVVGTYCHKAYSNEMVQFDIQNDDAESLLCRVNEIPDIAIICIAQTNFDRCADDYETAYDINVTCMKRLLYELDARGVKVVYISSDNVFDGRKGDYTEQDATKAIGKYGMMKEEMEHHILNSFPEMCILRIAKPVSVRRARRNLLTEWEQKRSENEIIRCIRNNYISFVAIEDIFKICVLVGEKNLKGLYNVSGDKAYSRKELATKFIQYLGGDISQIVEYDLQEFGFKDIRPLNTSMKNEKIKKALNYNFIDVENVLKEYVEGIKMEKNSVRPGGDKKYFYVNDDEVLKIDQDYVENLKSKAKTNGCNRCTMCLHNDINAKVHEMINVMRKHEYIRPHAHPFKTETKIIIEGELLMIIFDDEGRIVDRYIMQRSGANSIFTTRIDMGIYHTNIPLTDVVFHEVITGPYVGKDDSVFPEWAPEIGNEEGVEAYLKNLFSFQ